ncbi:MAG TPA: NADP-dependent oxidoreductase [Candidatus Acidoferrum sp.]|jgi:NADPH:quinone reductase-like Zn-dependent oxidoreductase|nr:NADP-dependent oxidoreductase [Candidatus Acidoferrum sp.]
MKRLQYDKYGGPEVVRLASFTLPPPGEDEVLVRVAAASINPVDWKVRSGQLKIMTGSKFPRAMGADFAGTVEAVGSKVSRFKPGDAVVGAVSLKASGAFATKLITSQKLVVKKPDNLSFEQAAALPIAGVTAWCALVKNAQLARGQKVFINGAMGAVGQAAIAIAREIGAEVVGRVGPKSIAQAQSMGLANPLDYTKPLPENLNGIFDVVFDCHGSLTPAEEGRLKKKGGKIYDIAPTASKFIRSLLSRSRKIIFADLKAENLQQVVDLAVAGKLVLPIVKTCTLEEAPEVLASLERGQRLNGKAVITF